jgi:lysozyme family protein
LANEQGRYGSATRETVENPLSPKLGVFNAPGQIQGGGAGGVAGYDTSRIGESQRAIAQLLGTASTIYTNYMEKKKDQWELDGKLAYAQGKTEDEIRASGNKYTLGGFMTMNVRTSANDFYQNSLQQIDTTDKTIDPTEYRTKLSKSYADLSDKVSSSNDPFVKQLLAASAEETMPKLVEAQTKAHNTWRENETFTSYSNMLVSEGLKTDPMTKENGDSLDHLREILHPEVSGLSPERHREAVTNALKITLDAKDFRLQRAIAGSDLQVSAIQSKDLPPVEQVKAQAMSFVAQVEGGFVSNDGGKGPTLYGINSEANPTEYKLMKAAYDAGDTAGARAIAKDTYSKKYWDAIGAGSLPADMAIIAFDGAVNQGAPWMKKTLAELAKTGGGAKELLAARRQRYIEIAQNDPSKAKFLDPWLQRLNKLNTDSNSATPLAETVQGMVTEASMIKNLSASGYSAAQIETVVNASRQAEQKKSQEFDKTRILTEESIENQAKTEGNLPARLDDIARVKAQNGYSDEWAKTMAARVVSGVESQAKERDAKTLRANAMNSTSVYQTLPGEQQTKTIEEHRMQTIAAVANEPGLTDEQRNTKIREAHGKFLIERNAIDPVWSNQMEASLAGQLIDGKGSLKSGALAAYKDYLWLSQNSTPGFANKYIKDPVTQALITRAESLDAGNLNSEQALMTAAQMAQQQASDGVAAVPAISPKDLNDIVVKSVDKMTPQFFATFGNSNAQNYSDVPDWQIASAKTDPRFLAMLKAETLNVMTVSPDLGKSPELAVAQAMKNLQPRVEMVQGNILVSGKQSTIREDMGITATNGNVVGAAIDEYVRTQGKNKWGADFDATQVWARNPDGSYKGYEMPFQMGTLPQPSMEALGNTIRNQYKGLPPYHAEYDPVTQSVKIDLYQDYNKTLMVNRPIFIPAKDIGAVYNINVLKPDASKKGINLNPLLIGNGKMGD